MIEAVAGPLLIVARIMIGSLFIVGGLRHFPLLNVITPALAARRVPFPRAMLIAGSVWSVAFGVMLAVGAMPVIAAFALIAFTVVATIVLVNFWDKAEPERTALFNVFLSNIAIVGGLVAVAAAS